MENRITLNMDTKEAIVQMVEGNPGAVTVCMELMTSDMPPGLIYLCHLDDMNIYGSEIWVCFKDKCRCNIKLFKERVMDRTIKTMEPVPLEEQTV